MTPAVRFLTAFVLRLAVGGSWGASRGAVTTDRVDMPRSYLFSPSSITVKAGTKVTWTNSDQFTHGVRLLTPTAQNVGTTKPGESVSYTFTAPGTYTYDCPFHPQNMKGTVTVN